MEAEQRPHRPGSASSSVEIDRLTVIGATYREMDTDARERLFEAFGATDPLFAEQLTLHTCHRVEKIGLLANGREPRGPARTRRQRGASAIERVFLVAGGFDSAVVGEEQILGQVRDAFQAALDGGTSGPVLSELMRRAIRFGKRVRSEARPVGDRSLADRAGVGSSRALGTGGRDLRAEVGGATIVAGLHGGGSPQLETIAMMGGYDLEALKGIAKYLAGIEKDIPIYERKTVTPRRVLKKFQERESTEK